MEKRKINAKIIADSTNEHGNRITTYVLTYPRIIHAELLTHRLFSRNAASSRAIPAKKMIADVENDPFIPVAFQKAHKGMQGTEYLKDQGHAEMMWWKASQEAIKSSKILLDIDCTKQLVNRILEPYQWYTSIVTATEYDNFFELRCPQYEFNIQDKGEFVETRTYKSRKDVIADVGDLIDPEAGRMSQRSDLDWLKFNKGQGEIHISLLAEAMWDARNESTPKQLKAGEWHIPFGDKMDDVKLNKLMQSQANGSLNALVMMTGSGYNNILKVKIATARCARVSYLNFEGKDDYEADIKLFHRLLKEGHMSPFEHCARAMSKEEFIGYSRKESEPYGFRGPFKGRNFDGWSGNFRGFVQLRKEIENAPTRQN